MEEGGVGALGWGKMKAGGWGSGWIWGGRVWEVVVEDGRQEERDGERLRMGGRMSVVGGEQAMKVRSREGFCGDEREMGGGK